MASMNREIFIIFLVFFILFTPAGSPPYPTTSGERHRYNSFLQLQRNETELLINSTYNSIGGNITGIVYPYNETSFIPKPIQKLASDIWFSEENRNMTDNGKSQVDLTSQHVYFSNYSGMFNGFWDKLGNDTLQKITRRNMTIPRIYSHNKDRSSESNETTPYDNALQSNYTEPELYGFSQLPTMDKIGRSDLDGNITEPNGSLAISVRDTTPKTIQNPNVTLMFMEISVKDIDEGSYYTISLMGLHIKPQGNVLLTTHSLKYSGLQYLPHLLPDPQYFDEAKQLVVKYLNKTLNIFEDEQDYVVLQDELVAADSCEFIFYGHFHSVPLTSSEIRNIEYEIESPIGRPIKPVPAMVLDSLVYSPDCALAIQSDRLVGEKYEQHWNQLRTILVAAIGLVIAQAILLAKQMKHTNTPSYMCKVSSLTIKMLSLMDNCVYLFSFASSAEPELALPLIAVAFLAFALTSGFELRYLVKIYEAQLNESEADSTVQDTNLDSNGIATFIIMPDGSFAPPRQSPQPSQQLPIAQIRQSEQSTEQQPQQPTPATQIGEVATVPRKTFLYFCATALSFPVIIIIASFPTPIRRVFEFIAVTGFYSFWAPQVYRNVIRGYREPLLWSFVIGTSIIRVLPVLYLTLNTKNVFRHHYDPCLAGVTVIWLCIQIAVLYSQTVFGPRFFIMNGYLPALYDYHPILTQGDIESGAENVTDSPTHSTESTLDSSEQNEDSDSDEDHDSSQSMLLKSKTSSQNASSCYSQPKHKHKLKGKEDEDDRTIKKAGSSTDHKHKHEFGVESITKRCVDCAICMMPVELCITPRDSSPALLASPALILARRRYMVTPCRHVFHSVCMEQWMRTRLQCPICRNPLPAV